MNFIDLLTEKEKEKLKIVSLNKGQILFAENESCTSIGIVISGVIGISSFSYNGNEIVYNILGPNEIFGNNLIFSSKTQYKGNVLAKTQAKVALIDKNQLLSILQNNIRFLENYLEYQSKFTIELNTKIKLLSFDNAEERFLYFLYENGNEIRYKTVTDLAAILFLKRETLSRLISRLEHSKTIVRNKNTIKLYDK